MTAPEPTDEQIVGLAWTLYGIRYPSHMNEAFVPESWNDMARTAWKYVVTALAAAPDAEEAFNQEDRVVSDQGRQGRFVSYWGGTKGVALVRMDDDGYITSWLASNLTLIPADREGATR